MLVYYCNKTKRVILSVILVFLCGINYICGEKKADQEGKTIKQISATLCSNHDVIYIQGKQQGTKNSALQHTRQNTGAHGDFAPLTTNCCLLLRNESIHTKVFPLLPYAWSLHFRSSWGGVSKAFLKFSMNVSTWPASKILTQSLITVISWVSQLQFFQKIPVPCTMGRHKGIWLSETMFLDSGWPCTGVWSSVFLSGFRERTILME